MALYFKSKINLKAEFADWACESLRRKAQIHREALELHPSSGARSGQAEMVSVGKEAVL